jgi:hypothetical protein
MPNSGDNPDEDSTSEEEITALVPQRQFARNRLAERQQAILKQLHRRSPADSPSHPQLNAVWSQLRGEWSWLVLVPGEPDYSTADLARALAQTGTRLSVHPVEFTEARDLDLDSSTRLIARLGISEGAGGGWTQPEEEFASSGYVRPATKTIVALESPLTNPLALPIALASDGVVLCVRRGRDRLASVRETIQAVGANRVVCCVLFD